MKLELDHTISARRRPGPDWSDRLLELWREDEVLTGDVSAEHINDAIVRIVGTMYDCQRVFIGTSSHYGVTRSKIQSDVVLKLLGECLETYDAGDVTYHLYARGWVVGNSFDGSSLHRVVKHG